MPKRIIDLKEFIPGGASIELLRAEISEKYRTPFALIRYAIEGVEAEYGLRLDLGKQVFIDQLDDRERDKFFQEAAPKIVEILSSIIYPDSAQNGRGRTIDLKDSIPNGASVQLLRAEIPEGYRTPFALVRYAIKRRGSRVRPPLGSRQASLYRLF